MSIQVENGVGDAYRMKVNKNNEAHVYAVTITEQEFANREGDAYNINTGFITLTSDAETPVLYIKNNEIRDLHISLNVYGLETSTGGSATEFAVVKLKFNVDGGTTISNANAAPIISNRNAGSSKTLNANVYIGATGETMTGGRDHILVGSPDFARVGIAIDEIVPQGKTMGVTIEPPTGNTSMRVYAAVIAHLVSANRD